MSMKLVIVESPAKARTIGKMLGKDFIIKASMGHVRDLPERSFGVDIDHDFQPQYEENRERGKNLSELKSAAKSVTDIYLASDPDREGEAIAWHLQEVLAKANKKAVFHRVSFHEITRSAIAKAFEQPDKVNMDLVNSQQARRVLDRIVGYQTSPLLWSRIERGVSAGRVQSVALRLVCEREREIQAFKPVEYWNFLAKFESAAMGGNGRFFTSRLAKINSQKFEASNKTDADRILNAIRSAKNWKVSSIETQPRKKYASPPFITSTMQQAASSSLGFSANQTMRVAQQLYEGVDTGSGPLGLITYMRTDSVAIALEAQNACRSFIATAYGEDYVPAKANFYKTKSTAQAAHEAIRPTDVTQTPEKLKNYLEPQQLKLYTLIWRRFVASQMAPAQQMRTTVDVDGNGSDSRLYTFRSTATVTKFAGFLRAYNIAEEGVSSDEEEDTKDAELLGSLKENDACRLLDSLSEQKFTEPPPRFSEATLIKELESNGIGRPSTYATIVNTIQTRSYVGKEKGKLIPTELGFKINDYLVLCLPELFQVGFTALMEDRLDHIEEGKIEWTEMLRSFYGKFSKWLTEAKGAGAPDENHATGLLEQLQTIQQWETPEKVPGKRVFDDKKFFNSVLDKHAKGTAVSERQWEALLSLALKYEDQLPTLENDAEMHGYKEELEAARIRRTEQEALREERRVKREEAEASAPPQERIGLVFKAMDSINWEPAEKRRGRVFDDRKFYDSLKKQSESGKALSEKQMSALSKILQKYSAQLPNAAELSDVLGVSVESASAPSQEVTEDIRNLLDAFSKVTQWAEPVRKGRRMYDDKEFVESISTQMRNGKVLSDRQIAALKKLGEKYFSGAPLPVAGTVHEEGTDTSEKPDPALAEIFRLFESFTDWEKPEKSGRFTRDDQAFVASVARQFKNGKSLSGKQIAAIQKMRDKYFPKG